MNSTELINKRNGLWAQAEEIVTRTNGFADASAEDTQKYDAIMAEHDEVEAQCGRLVKHEALRRTVGETTAKHIVEGNPDAVEDDYRSAFDAYARRGELGLTDVQRSLLFSDDEISQRAAAVSSGVTGGYLVPDGFWQRLVETQKAFGGMLDAAYILSTDDGANIPWLNNDDTGNEGYIVGENVSFGDATDLQFGGRMLSAHTYTSGIFKVPFGLAQDSRFDLEGLIIRKAGMRIARRQNTDFTTGDAAQKPQGMIPNLTIGKTATSATAFTWQELLDTVHSVDPAYRGTNCSWMMHDLIVKETRKLVDGNNRPLYAPGISLGDPASILGYAIKVNQSMSSAMTTGQLVAAFGDYSLAYVIRLVNGAQLLTLRERFADTGQVGYVLFERADGGVDDTSAAKVLKLG